MTTDEDIGRTSTLVADVVDRNVVDVDGDEIGAILDVYLDNETGQPEWLAVSTSRFGTMVSFVPIEGATMVDVDVMVRYSTDQVRHAPRAKADGELSPEEESELYAHYGCSGTSRLRSGSRPSTSR